MLLQRCVQYRLQLVLWSEAYEGIDDFAVFDFNAGVIVENEPMEETCRRFIDYVIKVASGELTNNEKKGYREIAIFKNGVTL